MAKAISKNKSSKNAAKTPSASAARVSGQEAQSTPLHEMSPTQQAGVLQDIQQVLQARGVAGQVAQLHIEQPPSPAGAAVRCPPNTVRRVVCARQPDGTIVCQERCVPV